MDFEEQLQHFAEKISSLVEEHGHTVIYIPSPDGIIPPFSYTVGLHRTYGMPELALMNVAMNDAEMVLDAVVDASKQFNLPIEARDENRYGFFRGDMPVRFGHINADWMGHLFHVARAFANDQDIPGLQVLIPNPEGKFPGIDKGVPRDPRIYPILSIDLFPGTPENGLKPS